MGPIVKRAEAQVRLRVAQQVPQIEASNPADLLQPFLGGAVRQGPTAFTLRYDRDLNWTIDAGAIHGIARPLANVVDEEPAHRRVGVGHTFEN